MKKEDEMLHTVSDFPHSREHGAYDSQDNVKVKQSLLSVQ
jgi:hypothetical protein